MNWAAGVKRLIEAFWGEHVRVGIVTSTSGARVFVRWSGQSDPEPRPFPRLASYASPQPGDAVLCVKTSAGRRSDWVVQGAIEEDT